MRLVRSGLLAISALAAACGPGDAPLCLNEFMASNASTIQDESGAWPDWIELYNPSGHAVSLEGYSITDNLDSPQKAVLDASLEVPAGGFLILWADGDSMDGPNHLPFSLDADGEEIGLYQLQDGIPIQLDAVSFGPQETDVSVARSVDGGGEWIVAEHPTPGASNEQAR